MAGRAEALQLLMMSGKKRQPSSAHPERVEGGGLRYERRMRRADGILPWRSSRVRVEWGRSPLDAFETFRHDGDATVGRGAEP